MTSSPLFSQTIAVFGATSGIGLAVANGAQSLGAHAIAIGRDRARLAAIKAEGKLRVAYCDITKESEIEAVLSDLGVVNHVVVTAGNVVAPSPLVSLDTKILHEAVSTKLFGSLLVAKHAARRVAPGGSIGFTSGPMGRKIAANVVVKTTINVAVEAAVRQLARELAPVRVYGVSPGPVDTANWGPLGKEDRRKRLQLLASTLPVGFVASAEDTARAYLFAMQTPALTGTVIDLDSGVLVGS